AVARGVVPSIAGDPRRLSRSDHAPGKGQRIHRLAPGEVRTRVVERCDLKAPSQVGDGRGPRPPARVTCPFGTWNRVPHTALPRARRRSPPGASGSTASENVRSRAIGHHGGATALPLRIPSDMVKENGGPPGVDA